MTTELTKLAWAVRSGRGPGDFTDLDLTAGPDYAVEVPALTQTVYLRFARRDPAARIDLEKHGNQFPDAADAQSSIFPLSSMKLEHNVGTLRVESEMGDVRTYTVTFTRAAPADSASDDTSSDGTE